MHLEDFAEKADKEVFLNEAGIKLIRYLMNMQYVPRAFEEVALAASASKQFVKTLLKNFF